MLFDVEEYREIKHSGRKRSERLERIPFAIGDSVILDNPADYLVFIPVGLPKEFTSKDYAECAKVSREIANAALNILSYLKTVERVSKDGRYYVYRLNKYFEP